MYLSNTYEGSVHDKKICDEEDLYFPKEINRWQDTGFQDYHPKGVHTIQPIKKKKGKILDSEAKKYNQSVSRFRVYVEHVIGSNLPTGIYFVRAVNDNETIIRKVVKK